MTSLPIGYLVYCNARLDEFELDIPGELATPRYNSLQEAAQAAWEHFRGNHAWLASGNHAWLAQTPSAVPPKGAAGMVQTPQQLRDLLAGRENTIRAALECLLDGEDIQAKYLLAGSLGTTPMAFKAAMEQAWLDARKDGQ